jgi:hypothetical protein
MLRRHTMLTARAATSPPLVRPATDNKQHQHEWQSDRGPVRISRA